MGAVCERRTGPPRRPLKDFEMSLIDEAITLGTTLSAAKPASPNAAPSFAPSASASTHSPTPKSKPCVKPPTTSTTTNPDIKKKFTSALERNRRNQSRVEKILLENPPRINLNPQPPRPARWKGLYRPSHPGGAANLHLSVVCKARPLPPRDGTSLQSPLPPRGGGGLGGFAFEVSKCLTPAIQY